VPFKESCPLKRDDDMIKHHQMPMLLAMLLASLCAWLLKPTFNTDQQIPVPTLEQRIPKQFGQWKEVPSSTIQTDLYVKQQGERTTDNPYDDVLMRTYENAKGQQVQLAVAYGKTQRQEVKIHRPELCYYAQGFEITDIKDNVFDVMNLRNQAIIGKQMRVISDGSQQAISYWIRIGDLYSNSAWDTRLHIIQQGLKGHILDGVLVRASSQIVNDDAVSDQFQLNETLMNDLVSNLKTVNDKSLLIR